jgi:hypothetical protein
MRRAKALAASIARGLVIIVFCIGCMFGGLMLVGNGIDNISTYYAARDACLKHATNGYEIERCR